MNCGEIMFKFLDVTIMITNFTPAGVFLPSEKQKLYYHDKKQISLEILKYQFLE